MQKPKLQSDSWQEVLKFINKCPICSEGYDVNRAEVFIKNESARLVHFTCPKCQSYFMAMVVVLGQGLSSVGMITDLSLADAKRLYKSVPITLDEALDGYTLFSKEKFNSLFLNRI